MVVGAAKEEGCYRGVAGRYRLPGASGYNGDPAVLGRTSREGLAPDGRELRNKPTP